MYGWYSAERCHPYTKTEICSMWLSLYHFGYCIVHSSVCCCRSKSPWAGGGHLRCVARDPVMMLRGSLCCVIGGVRRTQITVWRGRTMPLRSKGFSRNGRLQCIHHRNCSMACALIVSTWVMYRAEDRQWYPASQIYCRFARFVHRTFQVGGGVW